MILPERRCTLVALYVTSVEKGSGKTTICAGLGKRLLNEGKKVGYLKPIINDSKSTRPTGTDNDAVFLKRLFALSEPLDILCPVLGGGSDLISNIIEVYSRVSTGKDIIVIEGTSEQYGTAREIATALNARVLIIESYPQYLKNINNYIDFGQPMLGIIVNKVPKNRMDQTRREVSAQPVRKVNILGVLPEDRTLLALTVGELAECIQGEILLSENQSSELVENIMLGAMTVDHGSEYFNRKNDKAVIVKSERPDMQLAALQTSTKCLVLTGDTPPRSVVLDKAEEKHIPIVLARKDTATVVKNIEDALVESRFKQEKKLARLEKIIDQYFDYKSVYKVLGLAG